MATALIDSRGPARQVRRARRIELGICRFIFADHGHDDRSGAVGNPFESVVEEIERADAVGIDVFGIGEHHARDFLDSAPHVLLGVAAARTKRIRLTTAATILSVADPVRLFEELATLDVLSDGRAEIIAGRGSAPEPFRLFGLGLQNYDASTRRRSASFSRCSVRPASAGEDSIVPPLMVRASTRGLSSANSQSGWASVVHSPPRSAREGLVCRWRWA
jgi:hypothetical protein